MRDVQAKAKPILIASAILTLLSGLAFINNVIVLIRWRIDFVKAAGDANKISSNIGGPIPWLDWSAVDYSCVSTFIPFLGFLLFTLAILRILRGRRMDITTFPFFKFYDQMNVSLGLVGTLWGIIMIGYYDMETVTMASLMLCLHTALFSTLVAVVWVFLIVHPILNPIADKLLKEAGLAIEEDDRGLEEILSELRAAADGIGATLAREGDAVTAFSTAVESAASRITTFSTKLDDHAKAIERREKEADEILARRLEAINKAQDAALDAFVKAAAEASKTASMAAEEASKTAAKTTEETKTQIGEAIKAAIADMARARTESEANIAKAFDERLKAMDSADMERRKKFAEALSVRLREMDEAQAARERKFDEILQERLTKLSAESLANAERAAKAETTIARIRSAFE